MALARNRKILFDKNMWNFSSSWLVGSFNWVKSHFDLFPSVKSKITAFEWKCFSETIDIIKRTSANHWKDSHHRLSKGGWKCNSFAQMLWMTPSVKSVKSEREINDASNMKGCTGPSQWWIVYFFGLSANRDQENGWETTFLLLPCLKHFLK